MAAIRSGAEAATDTEPAPDVSVVVSTYNRSNVLAHALQSLVRQTHASWEAWVIGDCCTDDSAQMVSRLDDPRVRWLNLTDNLGDQSGPNSIGGRLARGRFVAWLNHDDLWLPEHLASMIAAAEEGRSDFVASGWLAIGPHAVEDLRRGRVTAEVWNSGHRRVLSPRGVYPASTWLVRRSLVRTVGDWRRPDALRGVPSQDFVYRCWSAGARMSVTGRPTVVAIQSGKFDGAYVDRRSLEHDVLAPLVARSSATDLQATLLPSVHPSQAPLRDRVARARRQRDVARKVARAVARHTAMPVAARLGVGPHEFLGWLDGSGRGAFMAELRRRRGLPEHPGSG